ncbi:MAG: ribosome biogenesis GTP-binding protein YihA/YsxC [Candidatus Adiutrix sp.]|jgi:GTP-binding protein|nr:ribosome biogenesis GTP-binding protein YihA/YsxC [Candidatus Adiutrix sp.]
MKPALTPPDFSAQPDPPAQAAEFLVSAAESRQFPAPGPPELALLGRSNAGKSSLLNRLLGRRSLARVGAAPGRTRQINFFRVIFRRGDEPFLLADLPGYGFAAAPRAQVAGWRALTAAYLESDRPLKMALLLMDIRRDPSADEHGLLDWLAGLGRPAWVVATKSDKLGRGEAAARLRRITGLFEAASPLARPPLAFSAATGQGRAELVAGLAGSGLMG